MKQKLLLFVAVLTMTAMGASAQWTKPTLSNFADMATDGATIQFMYNVGTQRFLVGANSWNTRASVEEQGDSVKVEALDDGLYAIHAIAVRNAGKTAWGYVSCNSWDAMWMDGNLTDGAENAAYPGTLSWKIRKEGDIYKLTNSYVAEQEELGDENTWGVAELFEGNADNRLYIYYPDATYTKTIDDQDYPGQPAFEGTFYDEWKFVGLTDYEQYVGKLNAYNAAVSLIAAIEKAEEENPGIDLSAQRAVYNNTNATAEELKAAEAAVSAAIVDFVKGKATWESPVNFSSMIQNATFDVVGDFTGWQGSGFVAGGDTDTCAEKWKATFDTYQDIEGLPEGVYMLQCNGYCRVNDSAAGDYAAWSAGTATPTKLYLNSTTQGYFSNSVLHAMDGASETSLVSTDVEYTYTDDEGEHTVYIPNTMVGANAYFHDGRNAYRNNVYGVLAKDEALRIGVSSTVSTDWNIFDDFELYYYGDDIHAYQEWGKLVAENSNVSFDTYYGAPEKALYDNAIATLTSANSKDAIVEAVKNLDTVADSVEVSKTNYTAYIKALKECEAWLNTAEQKGIMGDAVDRLASYIDTDVDDNETESEYWSFPNGVSSYIVNWKFEEYEGKLSAAAIVEETAFVKQLMSTAISEGIQYDTDLTDLIVNASFSDGFNGWTNLNGTAQDFSALTPAIPNNVEVYGSVVDCRQTINHVRPGIYALTVKAFERPAFEGEWTGDEASKVFIFMNDFQTPVQHIARDAMPEDKAIDAVNCYITQTYSSGFGYDRPDLLTDYGYVPNGMVGAAVAFRAGRYSQTCYGLVGSDSIMTLGITSNGVACHWVLWSDFRLVYKGKDETALSSLINDYADRAAAVQGAGLPDQDALDKAVEAAQSAADGDAMYDALFVLIDAYNKALESAATYTEADQAIADLTQAIAEYAETASDEALANGETLNDNYAGVIADRTLSGAEMSEVVDKIKDAIADLKIPRIDELPTDFTSVIQNPDFATASYDPWIITVGATNKQYQSATYTNDVEGNEWNGTTIQGFIETWRSGAVLDDGYIYQVINKLPAGQYRLECDAIASWQSNASTEVKGVELVMAQAASDEEVTSYSGTSMWTGNGKPEHFAVEFSKAGGPDTPLLIGIRVNGTNANWVAGDNFQLWYVGASLKGDVNEDGVVDIKDVVAVINHIAGTATYSNANVNGDTDDEGNDIVDINDVVAIINIMAGN